MQTKHSWPELVGTDASKAEEVIRASNSNVKEVKIVPHDTPLTKEYNPFRVRVFVDENNQIVQPPSIA